MTGRTDGGTGRRSLGVVRKMAVAAGAALLTAGCSVEPPPAFSAQAILLTLPVQETIRLDPRLAGKREEVLERCRELDPLLACVLPVTPWRLSALFFGSGSLPDEVARAWSEESLESGHQAMDRLTREFGIREVRYVEATQRYEASFAPADQERGWLGPHLRMDLLSAHFEAEIPGLEVEVVATDDVDGSRIGWSEGPAGWEVELEWRRGTCQAGCSESTVWSCSVPRDPDAAASLEESGDPVTEEDIGWCERRRLGAGAPGEP